MKGFLKSIIALIAIIIITASCTTKDDTENIELAVLPPVETMVVDFSNFMDETSTKRSASSTQPGENWLYPRIVVGVWNTALFTTLVVPVSSFSAAFNQTPEYLGNGLWEWTYTIDGFAGEYNARLTGQLSAANVAWEMYIGKTGVGAFDEFMWFYGNSHIDGNSGTWVLNQSPEHPNKLIQINWLRENEEISSIKYTWVRENNDQNETDLFNGSYLTYGKQDGNLDVYFNVHAYDQESEVFNDVQIEWNSTVFNGRVRASSYFDDDNWHCWDSEGEDEDCE